MMIQYQLKNILRVNLEKYRLKSKTKKNQLINKTNHD